VLSEERADERLSTPIEKWTEREVFQWLSTVDEGELYELATKLKQNRIRGRVLRQVTDIELSAMNVPLGDRLHFTKVRSALFARRILSSEDDSHWMRDETVPNPSLNINVSNTLSSSDHQVVYTDHELSQHTVPTLHHSAGSGRRGSRSHSQSLSHSLPGHRRGTISMPRHPPPSRSSYNAMAGFVPTSVPSVSQSVESPYAAASSPWRDNVDDDMLTTVEESPYAAIDPRHLEGFEADHMAVSQLRTDKEERTPSIGPQPPIQLTRSLSEGVRGRRRPRAPTVHLKLPALRRRHSVSHHPYSESVTPTHPAYPIHPFRSVTPGPSSIQRSLGVAAAVTPDVGTQVAVYSPKSRKWRKGLVLELDEQSKKGKICCYNSMGRVCKNVVLSLPSPLVQIPDCLSTLDDHRDHRDYRADFSKQAVIPMTVDSWNRYYRERE